MDLRAEKKGKGRSIDEDYIVFLSSGFRKGTSIRAIIETNPSVPDNRPNRGVIDENCKYVIPPEYWKLSHFMNNNANYYIFTKVFYRKQKAPALPPTPNREKQKPKSSIPMKPWAANPPALSNIDHTKAGIMDVNGNIVVPAEYDSIECDEEKEQLVAKAPTGMQVLKFPD